MAPYSLFRIPSTTPTAAAVFPRATAPHPSMSTNDVFTMPYPSTRNNTEHFHHHYHHYHTGSISEPLPSDTEEVERNATGIHHFHHHYHHSTDEMLAPLSEGEPPIEPETPPPPPADDTSLPPPDSMSELPILPETPPPPPATYDDAPPPPDSMGELPLPPDARILPRALNVTSSVIEGNQTDYAVNTTHSSALGRTLFVIVVVAGGILAMSLVGGAVWSIVKYRRKQNQERKQEGRQQWPGRPERV